MRFLLSKFSSSCALSIICLYNLSRAQCEGREMCQVRIVRSAVNSPGQSRVSELRNKIGELYNEFTSALREAYKNDKDCINYK